MTGSRVGFSIDELVGGVSTKQDKVSVAKVTAKAGTSEPWLTLHYEEWLSITKGTATLALTADTAPLEVHAGQTVYIVPGTRFKMLWDGMVSRVYPGRSQPSFPVDTEYIAVCAPAFRPDRCIREDTEPAGESIAANLKELHAARESAEPPAEEKGAAGGEEEAAPEVLFHMTTLAEWNEAKASGDAYYPKTFEQDDYLTHATGVPSRLLDTANHYYQDVEGAWVCLEFTRTALRKAGIFVRDEHATAVGDKPTSDELMGSWVCPHVIGGLPVSIVRAVYPMRREGAKYVAIEGVVDEEAKS